MSKVVQLSGQHFEFPDDASDAEIAAVLSKVEKRPDEDLYRDWLRRGKVQESDDYDTYGAFKAGLKPDSRGHLDDRFKLPNHITFSKESVYAGDDAGEWVQTAAPSPAMPEGTWAFRASPINIRNAGSKEALKAYFDEKEPGSSVLFPDGESYIGQVRGMGQGLVR